MKEAYVSQDIRATGIVRSQKCKRLTLKGQKGNKYRQIQGWYTVDARFCKWKMENEIELAKSSFVFFQMDIKSFKLTELQYKIC